MRWLGSAILVGLAAATALAQAERSEVPVHPDPVVQGVQAHLNRLCEAHDARLAKIKTEAELKSELTTARRRFLTLLGVDLERPRKAPPVRLVGTVEAPEYRIEKLVLESSPGVPVTCNLYVPKNGPAKKAALLVPHGHSGRDRPTYQNGYQRLARAGFIVLAKDGWGKQERRGTGHGEAGGQLFLTGTSLMALELWDNVRCLDYLLSRPDVDGERLGMVGLSGGGTQTLYAAAVDPRIRAASPTCAATTFRSDLADTTMCVCELHADLLPIGDHGLFLGMAYPRPILVVNGTRDSIFPVAGARAAVRQAQGLYAAGGQGERVRFAEFDAPHEWNDAMLDLQIGWLRQQFGLPPLPGPPLGEGPRPYSVLRSFPDGDLPANALTLSALNRERMQVSMRLDPMLGAAAMLRERWSGEPALPAEITRRQPALDRSGLFTREELTWASGLGGTVRAAITRPAEEGARTSAPVVIRLDRDRSVPEMERLYWEDRVRTHSTVVDLAYTGKGLAPEQEGQVGTALLVSGRSLLAERARDLLVTLQVLRGEGLLREATVPTFFAHGFDGVLLLHAADLLPKGSRLVLHRTPVTYRTGAELDFTTPQLLAPPIHWSILPGLARSRDLSNRLDEIAGRPILLLHPLDAAQEALDPSGWGAVVRDLGKEDLPGVEVFTRETPARELLGRLNRLITGGPGREGR